MTESRLEFSLPYIPPLAWDSLLGFLSLRATPGVEAVDEGVYRRTIVIDGTSGDIEVCRDPDASRLMVSASAELEPCQEELRNRIERVFDLAAEPAVISGQLVRHPALALAAAAFPGIRVPGSWGLFEIAVRAILGQVVSVKAATSLAGRLTARCGAALSACTRPGLTHLFPTPDRIAAADLSGVGLSGQKMNSLRTLALAVTSGGLRLDGFRDLDDAVARLLELPGVGPWTANYIAMRALGEPDAFPAGDLILRRAAAPEPGITLTEAELSAMAEQWRPWRAYAAMMLWASYSQARHKKALQTAHKTTGSTATGSAE